VCGWIKCVQKLEPYISLGKEIHVCLSAQWNSTFDGEVRVGTYDMEVLDLDRFQITLNVERRSDSSGDT
jgi:hypothetical protein